jgi:hypothetical protein
MLSLVPLESLNHSKPSLLKAFLKISLFSWRIFDVKTSTPTCTPLKIRAISHLTHDCLLNLERELLPVYKFLAPGVNKSLKELLIWIGYCSWIRLLIWDLTKI